jgi:ribonuclease BN (tRNA processing enzyme)
VRLTILGSNGTYPTPGRPASGYLVEHDGTRLWIDAGHGTFAALQDVIDLSLIDAVLLSHIHPDHCVDIFGFYHALRYGEQPRYGIPTFVPEKLAEHLIGFLGGDANHPITEVLDFRTMDRGDRAEVGGVGLEFGITDHPVPTLAARLETGGRSLVYSSDTGVGGDAGALATGASVFLCEATYQGSSEVKPWPHHLTAGEAGSIARIAGAGRLVLTHLWPTFDPDRSIAEAEATFGRAVGLAVPGAAITI